MKLVQGLFLIAKHRSGMFRRRFGLPLRFCPRSSHPLPDSLPPHLVLVLNDGGLPSKPPNGGSSILAGRGIW